MLALPQQNPLGPARFGVLLAREPARFDRVRALCTLLGVALVWCAASSGARANGRMPGANDVLFDLRERHHLLVRASFCRALPALHSLCAARRAKC